MMTVGDIHNVTFEKAMRGYRAEDVDDFLTKVAQDFELLLQERDDAINEREASAAAAAQEKETLEKKLYILAEKIEQYRGDEENLKVALLNAQRLGETVVYEAKQKAEGIVYEAKTKATQMNEELRTQQAAEEKKLAGMRSEVSKFKTEVLDLYRHHIDLLGALPSQDEKQTAPILFATGSQPISATTAPTSSAAEAAPVEVHSAAPAARAREKAKPVRAEERPMQAEQGTFDFDQKSTDSFENYQGIRFDE